MSHKERKFERLAIDIQGMMKKVAPESDASALEAQIDVLVYELYGLTEEEIAVVEGRDKA
ncbi:MAG: hypothetical protein HOD49_06060 [Anaerolineae bacterium]|jgi:hypothetical protein|nr:hypothetical protein [Anaerolineae bacterium]MBT6763737.1 hypothetical protein [Prolixibacteraceae bacterium]